MEPAPNTLVDLLRQRAQTDGAALAYAFWEDGGERQNSITYAELDRQAAAIARQLMAKGAQGERALLLYPPGLDFIAAFFGCLYAGATAVPAYPPRLNRPMPRIQAIVHDAHAGFALTTTQILGSVEKRFEHEPLLETLDWIDTEQLAPDWGEGWQPASASPDQLAFLQYTSGSTSAPKGVMLTHSNLMYNLEMIRQGFQLRQNDRGVFWLPSYHDMGLIGGILEPMYVGVPSLLISPVAFLQRPLRWLQAITEFRATITGAPNFAFDLCVEKITPEQATSLDLTNLRLCFTGAEPVRMETLRAFREAFSPAGLRPEIFYPCYGLAEATLIAAGGQGPGVPIAHRFQKEALKAHQAVLAEEGDADAQMLVACGRALLDEQIRIVDPENGVECPENQVGEIWISGPNVAQGYWARPDLNREVFSARLEGHEERRFLRTGDLGFFHQGELFITGRLKDLMIIRGKNHYPQDIERTLEKAHTALQVGACAAFSFEEQGQEKLAVVCETTRQHRHPNMDEIVPVLQRAVAENHQVRLSAVTLVKPLSIPKTSSGKIKRRATREAFLEGELAVVGAWRSGAALEPAAPQKPANAATLFDSKVKAEVLAWIRDRLALKLELPAGSVSPDEPFVNYGLDSAAAVSLTGDLEEFLGRSLSPTLAWDYPTPRLLAEHLAGRPAKQAESAGHAGRPVAEEPVAIIGMACRFPGADDLDSFWQLLISGTDAVSEVPPDRFPAAEIYDPDPTVPGKTNSRWGGFIRSVDHFDPGFFGISPREATRMDPQQRLLLEVAWEALESAGLPPGDLAGSRSGVFIGISSYDYSRRQFADLQHLDAYAGTGNAHSIAANRLSYLLDLRGPSMAVDTACSSSLVSVHMACQSLRQGETDLGIAGGVNLILSPELNVAFSQARMLSPQGRCRTFDGAADGYVRGEGCGVVILKRLSEALRDGDPIFAVVRGSAVNQDGRSNGLTAPNGPSQEAVILSALEAAGADPSSIGYVEAHGTGTPLGDPIEIHALANVLASVRQNDEPLFVGSVKTNLGHLEAAAGIAGLIKTALALKHAQIPPHLHFESLNPYINLGDKPIRIPTGAQPWERARGLRLAGVSSFGFGGTNAHLVLAEAPAGLAEESDPPAQGTALLALSARSERSLRMLAEKYASADLGSLHEAAYTSQVGRSHFEFRLAVPAGDGRAVKDTLADFLDGRRAPLRRNSAEPAKVAFLFSGQGAQFPGMGRVLYERQPVFRAALDRCSKVLDDLLDQPLADILFQKKSGAWQPLIHRTRYTQPALFALEYALGTMWRSWGIEPVFVLGHSLGELVAACLAEVMPLEAVLQLVAARGRLMDEAPGRGGMLAAVLSESRAAVAAGQVSSELALASVNGPESVVISGQAGLLEKLQQNLEAQGVVSRFLEVSQAFHSPLMDPVLEDFQRQVEGLPFSAPNIPLVSNLDGEVVGQGQVLGAGYWTRHIRQPVHFYQSVRTLLREGVDVFLEVGPRPVLLGLTRRILNHLDAGECHLLASMDETGDEWETALDTLGRLYELGLDIDWQAFQAGRPGRKVLLPAYPFDRSRYWLEEGEPASAPTVFQGRRLPVAVPLYELEHSSIAQDALLHLAIGAVREFSGVENRLQEIRFAAEVDYGRPGPHRLQISIETGNPGGHTFRIFLRQAESEWTEIASGKAEPVLAPAQPSQPARAETHPPSEAAPVGEPPSRNGVPRRSGPAREDQAESQDENKQGEIEDFLAGQLSHALGLRREDIRPDRPLNTLGLDSLMALEVRNAVETHFGVQLPIVRFLEGPTMKGLSEALGELIERQVFSDKIPVADAAGPHPLTHGQQAMWFLHELTDDETAFNIAGAARVRGPFEIELLETALAKVMDRHPALRTTFRLQDGEPVQDIATAPDPPLLVLDAMDWAEDRISAYLQREAWRKFNLQTDPPFRVRVLKVTAGGDAAEHLVLFSVDHLVADFWSVSLILRDLFAAYEQPDAPFPSPNGRALQFTDFARWQRRVLAGKDMQPHLDYWHRVIGEGEKKLDLPGDRPRPAMQTFRGDAIHLRLPERAATRLKELAKDSGTTLFNLLLAAFQALLYRYTGQESFLVGSVMAGRERPELADLVGYFINPVAIQAEFGADLTFLEHLENVRQRMLEAFGHQDIPPALLADHLQLPRDHSRPPLFETMFIFQKAQVLQQQGLSAFSVGVPGSVVPLSDLELEVLPLPGQPSQFDLTLMMAEADETLLASLQYNRALFDEDTVSRMLEHFQVLLEGIGDRPDSRVRTLPLVPEHEKALLRRWNRTRQPLPEGVGVHSLFESSARSHPEKTAAVYEGKSLTYGELEQRANRLANYLVGRGVGPESLVGVYMQRSLDMLVALLGILKAGGAYVPLDPSYPEARIAYMVADAGLPLILSHGDLTSSAQFAPGAWVDVDDPEIQKASSGDVRQEFRPENPAYVIYTSGSTGKPKGVEVPHRAVVNFLLAMASRPGLRDSDRLLAVTTLSFDISVLELFLPLAVGGVLVIAGQEAVRDGAALAELLAEESITVMQATPATWRLLLESGWEGSDGLRVLCGGEVMPADLAEALLPRCAELWNMYGPTETTVWSTVQRVEEGRGPVPIGRPISNTEVFVLDGDLQPAPIGVFGELLIAGRGLARGYHQREALTREKFIRIPATGLGNGNGDGAMVRAYRTGDAVRWLPDGTLEYGGRIDSQVKLRGFRIELGEIEAAMNAFEGVQQAAAGLITDGSGQPALTGYLVLDVSESEFSTAALRSKMGRTLPDYMLPSRFVILDRLPLTLNGKIDRRSLPQPESTRPEVQAAYLAPRSDTEAQLAELCAQVLGIDRVGVRDNFFDLGGSSLQATRLVFRVRETFGVTVLLRSLFEEPTVESLAVAVENARSSGRKGFGLLEGMPVEALQAEALLDETIRAGDVPWEPVAEPREILLTGATGFLGAYLLRELLDGTTARVHCLVRADSEEAALERVRQNLAQYGIWQDGDAGRILPQLGDLSQPLLGIPEEDFERLGAKIDSVYHNGAMVNFIHPYPAHKPANVLGTQEVLRFAAAGRLKPVHFISTLSVFHTGEHEEGRVFGEDESLPETGAPLGGYAQSKWVAEELVRQAAARGIPVSIYRPGIISGHSQTGGWNHTDLVWSLGRACLAIGKVPRLSGQVDVVPVDFVSRAIVSISRRAAPEGRVFHLGNPVTYPYEEMVDLVRRLGLPVDVVPFDHWRESLFRRSLAAEGEDWNAFLPILEEVEIEQIFMPRFGMANTLSALSGTGISCPPVGPPLLSHYLKFFSQAGFLG